MSATSGSSVPAPRAVLLDFDGVLADTENLHIAAWQRTFDRMGLPVAEEVCVRAAEEDDREFLQSLFEQQGWTGGDLAGWIQRKQALTLGWLREGSWLYPGVRELIEALRSRDRPIGIVTGTWRENVQALLRPGQLEGPFHPIIAKEDLRAPKPDPAGYALAVEQLRVPPEEVVALEDSPSGIRSAQGAGLRTIAIGHRRAEGEWTAGSPYLKSLRPTEAVLRTLGLDGIE